MPPPSVVDKEALRLELSARADSRLLKFFSGSPGVNRVPSGKITNQVCSHTHHPIYIYIFNKEEQIKRRKNIEKKTKNEGKEALKKKECILIGCYEPVFLSQMLNVTF